jgi:hypothetical protein
MFILSYVSRMLFNYLFDSFQAVSQKLLILIVVFLFEEDLITVLTLIIVKLICNP